MTAPIRELDYLDMNTATLTLPASANWWNCVYHAATVVNGSPNVVGIGFGALYVGQSVTFAQQPNNPYVIQSITNATHLVLTTNYTGAGGATAMGLRANPPFNCDGESRLKGFIWSSVLAGTAEVDLSMDGFNWDFAITLPNDPAQSNAVYSFDINLEGANFYRVVFIDAGAGSTFRGNWRTVGGGGAGPSIFP